MTHGQHCTGCRTDFNMCPIIHMWKLLQALFKYKETLFFLLQYVMVAEQTAMSNFNQKEKSLSAEPRALQ